MQEELKKALQELRKNKERKFDQTVELILNLQKFNVKKDNVNAVVAMPHKIKEKKVAGFFEVENKIIDTILLKDFKSYADKSKVKHLVDKYDFFIAQASLMPKVATTFGKVLGPAGKMPSPQLGILMNVDDKGITDLLERISKSIKIRTKEASIKVPVGKQSMKDEDLIENITTLYNTLVKELPKQKENIKNISVKFTMTKPVKIEIK